ncbi:glycosyltransferase family 4 protein [Anianabacter salinae]|uniref:glycosyltransferase family 4 protein n=1 Tax=Anianabacter salinae TaxID=2851023 RepID=UPI00225E3EA2|nr:glycosyltransferase family 4 protein [Anianabacter salinae]MBV0913463.1 glycosyltransferase family 4 protein [Anianabacter salinae]
MRVLLTVNAMWNLAHFRAGLIRAMVDDGHEVVTLAPFDGNEARVAALGARAVDLAMDRKGLSPLRDAALIGRFAGHFRRIAPDAILSFTIKNNVYGGLAARLTRTPFLPNVTGLGTAFLSGKAVQTVAETLHRAGFARAPSVFFQNPEDAALFRDRRLVREDQVRVLPGSGIDLDHFRAQPLPDRAGAPRFLMISRPLRDKGVEEFVEAARMVKARHAETVFQLLGPLDAENRSAVAPDVVAGWAREGVIEHLGQRDDVRPAIAAADCVVLPSYREGLPRSLLEGSAMARPLIATDVPGCRTVVDDGTTGLLCDPRSAKSLADAMERIIQMGHEDRVRMGQAGRQKIESRFRETVVIAEYRSCLSRL